MYFVAGIHGVGKTTCCKRMQEVMGIPHFSASEIIQKVKNEGWDKEKRVSHIDENQRILILGLKETERKYRDFILDGHICLINLEKEIVPIDFEVFKVLKLKRLIIVVADPEIILQRLQSRDHVTWDISLVKKMQAAELAYGRRIANKLKIEMDIIQNNGEFIEKMEKNNIILPIKPIYAEKILSGEKTYEYRKKLCKKDIDIIYIYATAPRKCIIGEVKVNQKVSMEKERLWKESSHVSGIDYNFYNEYFKKEIVASAYQLGEYKKYEKEILLSDIGIDYTPQSHIYIEKLIL